jgi:hypothetical protein
VFAELDMLDLERTLAFVSCVAEMLKKPPLSPASWPPSHEGGVEAEGLVRVGPLLG